MPDCIADLSLASDRGQSSKCGMMFPFDCLLDDGIQFGPCMVGTLNVGIVHGCLLVA